MDTSNRASDKGLGMKRKGSDTLGSSPLQKPNFCDNSSLKSVETPKLLHKIKWL